MKDVTLESAFHHLNGEAQLNVDFHEMFTEIIKNRGNKIKLKIIQPNGNILETEEMIVKNG